MIVCGEIMTIAKDKREERRIVIVLDNYFLIF